MRGPIRVVLLSGLFNALLLGAQADTITLVADPWLPYSGEKTGVQGYMVDIAREVFKPLGHEIKYVVMPWARAIADTRKGLYSAIVGASHGDAEDFVFPSISLGKSGQSFFTLPDSTWTYKGLASLKGIRVAAISEYDYGNPGFNKLVAKADPCITVVHGEEPLPTMIKLVKNGRALAFVEDRTVLQYNMKQAGTPKAFREAGPVSELDDVYIAFSPANPKSKTYAALLSDGLKKLRASGALDKILARYGVTDWAR